jgi:tetratricopeptide (TPR) repeat protein
VPTITPAAPAPASEAPTGGDPVTLPNLTPQQNDDAIKHYDAAAKAFSEGRYDTALEEFTFSYEISKEPDLLYNLFKVADKMGQKKMALAYLQEYLRLRPAETTKLQPEVDKLNASLVGPVTPSTERSTPRAAGYMLIGVGSASLATAGILLGVMTTTADNLQSRAMLASGGFLLGAGALELIGGIVMTLKKRPRSTIALRWTGSEIRVAGGY